MFAVLKTGGKQYKVSSGDILRVEKLHASSGEKIQFNDILLVGGSKSSVGTPFVKDAAVQAEVIQQIKGDKVINFVKRRRKHSSKRTKGHRQQLTLLRITDILTSGASKTGVKEALNGSGLKIQYTSVSDPSGPMTAPVKEAKAKAEPKKEAPAKEAKAKAEPKKAAPARKSKSKPTSDGVKKVTKENKNGS